MISGSQDSGKTTLLRAMCAEFDPLESVTTIEAEPELHLDQMPDRHRRVHALEVRPGSGERLADGGMAGAVGLDDLARLGWRLNTERIIVGEVLGAEILEMFNLLRAGVPGLCTVHASTARMAINRMGTLALAAGTTPSSAATRSRHLVDLVVQVAVATDAPAGGTAGFQRCSTWSPTAPGAWPPRLSGRPERIGSPGWSTCHRPWLKP